MSLFEIQSSPIETDLPIIVKNVEYLLYYDFPLLYIGENKYRNFVLGYWVGYDEKEKIERYFHVILDSETYYHYVNKKITLLDILKRAKPIFIMDYNKEGKLTIYQVNIDKIPIEYLPPEESYYPGTEFLPNKIIASINTAKTYIPVDVFSTLQKKVTKILYNPFTFLKLKPKLFIAPPQPGSFELHYIFQLGDEPSLFGEQSDVQFMVELIKNYLSIFKEVENIINILPNMNDLQKWIDFISKNTEIEFFNWFKEFTKSSMDENARAIFIKDFIPKFYSSLEDTTKNLLELSEDLEEDEMTIFQGTEIKKLPIINILGRKDIERYNYVKEKLIEKTGKERIIEESYYKILIYHLNLLTRRGNAYIQARDNPYKLDKPKIKILGTFDLSGTKFTESLHKSVYIEVKAKAEIINNRYIYLEILEDH